MVETPAPAMNKLTKTSVEIVLLTGLAFGTFAQQAKPLYENDFEQAALDKVPDDFLVLDGQFTVKEEGGNKFLELPGAPLDTYGVLFGPTEKERRRTDCRCHPPKRRWNSSKVTKSKPPCRINGSRVRGSGYGCRCAK